MINIENHKIKTPMERRQAILANASNRVYGFILFLIWPFASLITSVKNFSNIDLRIFILLYFVLFGATAVITENNTHDAYNHVKHFEEVTGKPFNELLNILGGFFSGEGSRVTDLYVTLVNFVISRFTDDYRLIFAFHSLFFGYFYLKSTALLFDEFKRIQSIYSFIALILFISIIPIDKVQFVRFWTAAWVYFFAVYQLINIRNIKLFLFLFLSIFIHTAFILPVAVFLIYLISGNRLRLYLVILFVSFIVPNLLSNQLSQFNSLGIGEVFDERVTAYGLNDEYIAQRNSRFETRSWYVRLQIPMFHYSLLILLGFIYLNRHRYKFDKFQISIICFSILFLSFVNFGYSVASVGERFHLVYFLLILAFLYRHFSLNPVNKTNYFSVIIIPSGVLWFSMQMRFLAEFMNIFMIIGNPIVLFSNETDISVINFIDLIR